MPYTAQIDLLVQTQLCDRLRHLTLFSSHLLFVSGDPGAGKSTVLVNYVESDFNRYAFAIDAGKEFGEVAIRTRVLQQISFDGRFNAQQSLANGVAELHQQLTNDITICIDNAQHLTGAFVAELVQLVELSRTNELSININVLLFANSDWVDKALAKFSDTKAYILELEVEQLDPQAAMQFVQAQFKQANYDPQFANPDALSKQVEACEGNPEALLQCAQAIMKGEVFNPKAERTSALQLAMTPTRSYYLAGFIALLVIFGGGSSFLYDAYQAEQAENARKAALAVAAPEVLPSSIENAQAVLEQDAAEQQKVTTAPVVVSEIEDAPLFASNWEAELPTQLDETITLTGKDSSADSNKKRVVIDDVDVKKIIKKTSAEPVVESKPAELTAAEKANLAGRDWIKAQPQKNYTFQIAGLSRAEQVQLFLDEHGLAGQVQTYTTQRNNKPWFVVLYGSFASVKQANLAKAKLPAAVQQDKPWMKTFVQIQREL